MTDLRGDLEAAITRNVIKRAQQRDRRRSDAQELEDAGWKALADMIRGLPDVTDEASRDRGVATLVFAMDVLRRTRAFRDEWEIT